MRIATAPHHTNPRSATLDFWRKEKEFLQSKKFSSQSEDLMKY